MTSGSDGRAGKAYQRAFEAVLAIPIGIGIGYFADQRFDSSPVGLLIGVALGFAAFVKRLVSMRSLVEDAAQPKPQDEPGKTGNTDEAK